MSALRTYLIAVLLAAVLIGGIYEAHQASVWSRQYQELEQQTRLTAERLGELKHERDSATRQLDSPGGLNAPPDSATAELLRLRAEVVRLRNAAPPANKPETDPATAAAQAWLNRERSLKARLEQIPEAKIPELALLTEQDWLNAAKGTLETEEDYRRALAGLRSRAENLFLLNLFPALQSYRSANNGQFPTDISALRPYFKSPVDEAMLQQWTIVPAADSSMKFGGDWIITQKSVVDAQYDTPWGAGPNGYGNEGPPSLGGGSAPLDNMASLMQSYIGATGQIATDPSLLLPYATNAEQKAAIQTQIHRFNMLSASQKAELSSLDSIAQSYINANGQMPVDPSLLLPFTTTDEQKNLVEKNIRQFQMLSTSEKEGMSTAVQRGLNSVQRARAQAAKSN